MWNRKRQLKRCQYICKTFNNDLSKEVKKENYKEQKNISRWLILSFIKSIFGGNPDRVLTEMRNVLKDNKKKAFPIDELMDRFKGNPQSNYSFDDEYIDELLERKKDSTDAYYILRLLYPDLNYRDKTFAQDHLHPKIMFTDNDKFEKAIPTKDQGFAKENDIWNSVLNLQLLNGNMNSAKKDKPLKDWAKDNKISNRDLYLSAKTSLDIKDFKSFIKDRRKVLKKKLKDIVK